MDLRSSAVQFRADTAHSYREHEGTGRTLQGMEIRSDSTAFANT